VFIVSYRIYFGDGTLHGKLLKIVNIEDDVKK